MHEIEYISRVEYTPSPPLTFPCDNVNIIVV